MLEGGKINFLCYIQRGFQSAVSCVPRCDGALAEDDVRSIVNGKFLSVQVLRLVTHGDVTALVCLA